MTSVCLTFPLPQNDMINAKNHQHVNQHAVYILHTEIQALLLYYLLPNHEQTYATHWTTHHLCHQTCFYKTDYCTPWKYELYISSKWMNEGLYISLPPLNGWIKELYISTDYLYGWIKEFNIAKIFKYTPISAKIFTYRQTFHRGGVVIDKLL